MLRMRNIRRQGMIYPLSRCHNGEIARKEPENCHLTRHLFNVL